VQPVNERLGVALRELYEYYRRAERMLANALRDEETMPIVRQMLGGFRQSLAEALGRDENLERLPSEGQSIVEGVQEAGCGRSFSLASVALRAPSRGSEAGTFYSAENRNFLFSR
jgi:hypothetical protein